MSSDAERLIDRARELHNLIEIIKVPESDRVVKTHSDDVSLGQVEVHADDASGMRAKKSLIALVGLIKHSQATVESSTGDFQAICRNINCTDSSLVLGLHKELIEVEGPYA